MNRSLLDYRCTETVATNAEAPGVPGRLPIAGHILKWRKDPVALLARFSRRGQLQGDAQRGRIAGAQGDAVQGALQRSGVFRRCLLRQGPRQRLLDHALVADAVGQAVIHRPCRTGQCADRRSEVGAGPLLHKLSS